MDGFANWYQVQAQEERDHAMLFVQYMQNNDLPITFEAIDKPDLSGLKENIDPLKAALKHEQYVTELIHTIYDAAADYPVNKLNLKGAEIICPFFLCPHIKDFNLFAF